MRNSLRTIPGVRFLALLAMALAAGIAEQPIQARLFPLLVGLAEGLVKQRHQAGDVAVSGFDDLLGRSQPRAGFAQQETHGVCCVPGGMQFGGQSPLHQRLGLRGRERRQGGWNALTHCRDGG